MGQMGACGRPLPGSLPDWQRTGTGFVWQTYRVDGLNPVSGETVPAQRQRIVRLDRTPAGAKIRTHIEALLAI